MNIDMREVNFYNERHVTVRRIRKVKLQAVFTLVCMVYFQSCLLAVTSDTNCTTC
jgi:hypothetical protein